MRGVRIYKITECVLLVSSSGVGRARWFTWMAPIGLLIPLKWNERVQAIYGRRLLNSRDYGELPISEVNVVNTSKIVELESLLSAALRSVTIRRGQSEQLSPAQFRQLLQRCREVYDPARSLWVSLFRPEISQIEVKEKVLGFVNRELGNYVRDGRIHSATIAFSGGLTSGSPVEDVLQNLLRRAIVDGPSDAAQAFVDCTTNSSCNFYKFFLLTGVSIPSPVEVFDGITLMPLPESASELPPHLPFVRTETDRFGAIGLNDLLSKTLVRVEYEVSPIFHRPAESYTFESGPDQHFSVKLKGQEIPNLDLNVLCQALAVAGRCSVESVMTWTSLVDYEIFDLSSPQRIGGSGYSSTMPRSGLHVSVQLSSPQIDSITTLYRGLTEVPTETWNKLRIPIDRWAKSMAEENPIDQIIDLGIALESLYVPDSQGEVNLRFALHAAWHLGKNKTGRQELRDEFRQIYAARCDVVHTGKLRGDRAKSSFDKSRFVSRAQELCWQGITSVIKTGDIPNWNDLIMGEDPE